MATMTVTLGNGKKEERGVDYLERDERTGRTLAVPVLKDNERIINCVDGSIIIIEI